MIRLGIFARTFPRDRLEDTLAAISRHGIQTVQFNLSCLGLPSLPDTIEDSTCRLVREGFENCGMEMAAISGTFNAVHPDPVQRQADADRCCELIRKARALGTDVVTLCTGTRDPESMWKRHPENEDPEAWSDLIQTMERLLPAAEESGVTLGIEPETANVINSAVKARQLLDQLKASNLKIIMDGANLFLPHQLGQMQPVLEEAFDLLGPDIVMAHAKDIVPDKAGPSQAAGTGALDYRLYMRLLAKSGFCGPIVLHNLLESEVHTSLDFVRRMAGEWYPELCVRKGAS
jgi:sugar phosphate isomerase/epimerase